MKLAKETMTYLLIALVCYLTRLALFIKAGKKRHNVVEELAQKVGSSSRRDLKIKKDVQWFECWLGNQKQSYVWCSIPDFLYDLGQVI